MTRYQLFVASAIGAALVAWLVSVPAWAAPRAEVQGSADFEEDPNAPPQGEAVGQHAGAEEEAGAHGGGGAAGGANPLSVDPDLAIYTLIIFLVLLGVLWKFAWGPISASLDKREQAIADQIAAAQAANEQAKELLKQYDQKLAQAQVEVRAIMDEARRDADHTRQEIMNEARADARAERDRAVREIERATDAALKELAERSANLAVDLAGRIVQAQLSPADHARLIEEAMARFPKGNAAHN